MVRMVNIIRLIRLIRMIGMVGMIKMMTGQDDKLWAANLITGAVPLCTNSYLDMTT